MNANFRFAVISDPHITLSHTVWDAPNRFHLVEVSIPAFEHILEQLLPLNLNFLLLPGDLTQHGESENHHWLINRLGELPFPVYVVPGNHDIIASDPGPQTIGLKDFPHLYESFGYSDPTQPYYRREIFPGVQLIGLNSIAFDANGHQLGMGYIDAAQLSWLEETLPTIQDQLVMVMVHHNVLEHLPGQTRNPLGRRYMTKNAAKLLKLLHKAGVQLIFTGHLHIQAIAQQQSLYEITTGSLVSYPHPYRVIDCFTDPHGQPSLKVASHQVTALPGWPTLQKTSHQWMSDRSFPFMMKLLTSPPLNLPTQQAERLAPDLKDFWPTIAAGDPLFDFPHFPPAPRQYFERFSALDSEGQPQLIDNHATLRL
ncbi:MAG: metallophosphoesterase [Leptolyngbyaceae cyanobacterium MO_188.B28]|nr:metallophosphoesterase [Leptolyngbyaceae cyanobacterium MO_188.B28]